MDELSSTEESWDGDSPDVDYDEWVGLALRRGNRWWVAPSRSILPNMHEEPEKPWVLLHVGDIDMAW